MFNFTLPELVVIFVVALIVFGPKKLPELGRVLGKAIGDLQRALQGVREHMDTEIDTTTHLPSGPQDSKKGLPDGASQDKDMERGPEKLNNDKR